MATPPPGSDPRPASQDGTEVQRADPAARRKAIVLWASYIAAGIAMYAAWHGSAAVDAWLQSQSSHRPGLVLLALALMLCVPLFFVGANFWRLGRAIQKSGRFPPPGVAVIQDTIVVRGHAAVRRGRLAQLFAAVLRIGAAGLCFALWRLAALLEPLTGR